MNFETIKWDNLKLRDKVLISNIETGLTGFQLVSKLYSSNSSIIYLLKSLSDDREVKYIANTNQTVYLITDL